MTETVTHLELWRLNLPLRTPYRLSFGPLTSFGTVLVHLTLSDGSDGWGEATLLPGYTDETEESAWAFARAVAPRLVGRSAADAEAVLAAAPPMRAFSVCAFRTAMEAAARHPLLATAGRVPLLGAVNEKPARRAALEAEVEQLLATGYGTLKVKVGFELEADLAAVRLIQDLVAGRARLRVDANQGFSRDDGVAFVSRIDPEGIELVEQPCKAGDWDAAVAVKRAAAVPIMLDESIYGMADIETAERLGCADYIKLKLMKMAGLDRLVAGLERIRAGGMRTVLGNGVATDLGCYMEAAVAVGHIDNAGEFNGFLRPTGRLMEPSLASDGPDVVLSGAPLVPAPDRVAAFAVASERFH